jgi:hypothetical protein
MLVTRCQTTRELKNYMKNKEYQSFTKSHQNNRMTKDLFTGNKPIHRNILQAIRFTGSLSKVRRRKDIPNKTSQPNNQDKKVGWYRVAKE